MIAVPLLVRPLVVYAAGVVTGPLIKPVVRGSVKGTVKIGLHVRRLAGEAAAEVHGIAAEASADAKPAPAAAGAAIARK